MQIFEINKKTKMFWFFLALPSFPSEKALKETKVVKETTILLTMAMPKQTCLYKNITFALGRARGLLF